MQWHFRKPVRSARGASNRVFVKWTNTNFRVNLKPEQNPRLSRNKQHQNSAVAIPQRNATRAAQSPAASTA